MNIIKGHIHVHDAMPLKFHNRKNLRSREWFSKGRPHLLVKGKAHGGFDPIKPSQTFYV